MKKKKDTKRDSNLFRMSPLQLKKALLTFLGENPQKAFKVKQLAERLSVANNKDSIQNALDVLIQSGHVVLLPGNRYRSKLVEVAKAAKSERKGLVGKVDMTKSGAAFIVLDDHEKDVFVSSSNLNTAQDGDRVEIRIFEDRSGRGRRSEGAVIKVTERARESFIGELKLKSKYWVVEIGKHEKFRMDFDVYVDEAHLNNAVKGNTVVVQVTEWPTRRRIHAQGKITTILGSVGSNDFEMNAILIQNGFDIGFPIEVEEEANALRGEITEKDISERRDFRKTTTLTIDPLTAKDFDDALSVEHLENGNVQIGVHIADVAHFVKPGSAIDKEAYLRSTSVYLVDRVAPMLPEKLSNELCSLRPKEESLTFSATFEFNPNKEIVNRWFGRGIIFSDARLTYEEAQDMIEGKAHEQASNVLMLNEYAEKLRKDRFKNGAISFESDEVQFELDEDKKPIKIKIRERKAAHMLVEEFMLLANKEVAEFINRKAENQAEIPFVYRVHDLPDPDRLENLMLFAAEMGFKFDLRTPEKIIKSFNNLAAATEERPELKILEPLAIRTMAKAVYTTENAGHYGLGFDFYTHFTSPIRRYSDVLVHRILEKNLQKTWREDKSNLEMQCRHISNQERKAMEAERESISYKQAEYMLDFIGQDFEGRVSGMIERGFFVELIETKAEGLVPFESLSDAYTMSENKLSAKGKNTGMEIKLGQKITVKIVGVDISKRNIDMEVVG